MPGCRVSNSGRERALLPPPQEGCVADAIGAQPVISQKTAGVTRGEGRWCRAWTPMLPPQKNRVGGNQNPPGHQLSAELSKPDFKERGGSCFDAEMRGMNGDRRSMAERGVGSQSPVSIPTSLASNRAILLIYPCVPLARNCPVVSHSVYSRGRCLS